MNEKFNKIAKKITDVAGMPITFLVMFGLVIGWFISGFYFEWSSSHSLFINTATTIVTFLMAFLILNTANRLDVIIEALEKASNKTIAIEEKSEDHIEEMQKYVRSKES